MCIATSKCKLQRCQKLHEKEQKVCLLFTELLRAAYSHNNTRMTVSFNGIKSNNASRQTYHPTLRQRKTKLFKDIVNLKPNNPRRQLS